MSIKFSMNSVAVAIQELFESVQSPSKICYLLKGRRSRSGVYKVLKRFEKTGSKVRSTPSRKVRAPKLIKNTREKIKKIFEEACKNWLLLLLRAMERCRLCLRMI